MKILMVGMSLPSTPHRGKGPERKSDILDFYDLKNVTFLLSKMLDKIG